jgi:hypothetical protein
MFTIGTFPSHAHIGEKPAFFTILEKIHNGSNKRTRTIQWNSESDPMSALYSDCLGRILGHSENPRTAVMIRRPRQGTTTRNESAGANPARAQIRQRGMINARSTTAPKIALPISPLQTCDLVSATKAACQEMTRQVKSVLVAGVFAHQESQGPILP